MKLKTMAQMILEEYLEKNGKKNNKVNKKNKKIVLQSSHRRPKKDDTK